MSKTWTVKSSHPAVKIEHLAGGLSVKVSVNDRVIADVSRPPAKRRAGKSKPKRKTR